MRKSFIDIGIGFTLCRPRLFAVFVLLIISGGQCRHAGLHPADPAGEERAESNRQSDSKRSAADERAKGRDKNTVKSTQKCARQSPYHDADGSCRQNNRDNANNGRANSAGEGGGNYADESAEAAVADDNL